MPCHIANAMLRGWWNLAFPLQMLCITIHCVGSSESIAATAATPYSGGWSALSALWNTTHHPHSQLGGVRSNTFGHEDTRKLNSNARLNWTVLDFKETANSAHFHYYLPNNLESCQNCAQVLSQPAGGSPAGEEAQTHCISYLARALNWGVQFQVCSG